MTTPPTIYMIRHGEKPPADGIGLSAAGRWRANQLPGVFGPNTGYNIRYILAEKPNEDDGHDERPWKTVLPLADSIGLKTNNNSFDIRFKRDKSKKVAEAVNAFQGPGDILICWEHKALTDLATAIGVRDAPKYDGTRFDLLWTLNADRTAIVDPTASYSIAPDPNADASITDASK